MPGPHTRLNVTAGIASASVALTLVLLKIWALGETGALSIAASLADSGLDLMISLGGLAAIIYAAKPPDEDHTFGHGSAEDLAVLGQAVFILLASGAIAVASLRRLFSANPPELAAEGRGMIVMGVSIVLTIALVIWQRYVASRTGNRVVQADSLHYLGDLLPNIGAILSLWASSTFGIGSVDSVIALGTVGLLAVGAINIGRNAWNALMDREADPRVVSDIEKLAAEWPGIHGYHDLRTRTAGSKIFVNLHVEIDGDLPLHEAHDIGAGLRHAILRQYPQADVIIHHDPVRSERKPVRPPP